jgi:septin family protein
VNILLFGLAGATKSSFINSILTMLGREDKIVTAAAAGGTARHQTTKLVRYELNKQLEGLHVNLFDTWGLTNRTYQGTELERILNGELPVGWKMEDAIEDNAQKLKQFQGSMALRKIHTVIFFIPQSALSDQSQEPIRKAIGFYYTKILHLGKRVTKKGEQSV